MSIFHRALVALIISLSIFTVPCYAAPTSPKGAEQTKMEDPRFDTANAPPAFSMIGDLVIARPLGLALTAAGTALFVVSLPFTLFSNNVSGAADALIAEPAKMTFTRCLGCTSNEQRSYED